ncbi:MAG: DUF4177 domain-containing protein [Isosphaeraceae bacterium]
MDEFAAMHAKTSRPRRWTWGSLTAVVVGVAAALASSQASRPTVAQVQKKTAEYRQSVVYYTRAAENLNEWTGKGWELVQMVPVANPNPGTGAAMQVLIVYKR